MLTKEEAKWLKSEAGKVNKDHISRYNKLLSELYGTARRAAINDPNSSVQAEIGYSPDPNDNVIQYPSDLMSQPTDDEWQQEQRRINKEGGLQQLPDRDVKKDRPRKCHLCMLSRDVSIQRFFARLAVAKTARQNQLHHQIVQGMLHRNPSHRFNLNQIASVLPNFNAEHPTECILCREKYPTPNQVVAPATRDDSIQQHLNSIQHQFFLRYYATKVMPFNLTAARDSVKEVNRHVLSLQNTDNKRKKNQKALDETEKSMYGQHAADDEDEEDEEFDDESVVDDDTIDPSASVVTQYSESSDNDIVSPEEASPPASSVS